MTTKPITQALCVLLIGENDGERFIVTSSKGFDETPSFEIKFPYIYLTTTNDMYSIERGMTNAVPVDYYKQTGVDINFDQVDWHNPLARIERSLVNYPQYSNLFTSGISVYAHHINEDEVAKFQNLSTDDESGIKLINIESFATTEGFVTVKDEISTEGHNFTIYQNLLNLIELETLL